MRVRYYGPVGLPTGYGDAANEFCMAMLTAGIDLEILTASAQLHQNYLDLAPLIRSDEMPPTPDPDVVIIHTLPLSCAKTLAAARVATDCPRAALIAYTTWEGLYAPKELLAALSPFRQIWVPSHVTARAIDVHNLNDVRVIPHATAAKRTVKHSLPPETRGDRPYKFYSIGAWTVRKNMDGVVRAYLHAFNKGDNVELRMHCYGAPPEAVALVSVAATGLRPAELPPIHFTNGRLSNDEIAEIHRSSDCFVSASRGESWNIPAFDAMMAGNHIIATAGLGHDEFLNDTDHERVDGFMVPATGEVVLSNDNGRMHGQYIGGDCLTIKQSWRDPEIAGISSGMRSAAQYWPTLRVAYDPAERFGRAAVGQLIKQALEEVAP